MTYHITKHLATGVTPFLLIYVREAVLSINEIKSLMIYERIISIVEKILHIREEARLMIQKMQDRIMQ